MDMTTAKTRREVQGYTRVTILKRRRQRGELASPLKSIRNHCLECCGYNHAEVTRCTAPGCWLYPFRAGCWPEPNSE